MPARSIAQQELFGMALAVRRGEMKKSDATKEVLDIVNSDMTDKEIEDFASTKHKGLKKHVKEEMISLCDYINERLLSKGWKEWSEDGYSISMLAFDEPSQYGIDEGKISKLFIKKGNKVVCNYDRGWDVEPKGDVKKLFDDIISKYN